MTNLYKRVPLTKDTETRTMHPAILDDMGTHMKTTVEIADALMDEARRIATRDRTTIRTLIEEGLRHAIAERARRTPFSLRKATFKGKGLSAEAATAGWDKVRESTYEGRGG